jgi:WD40 repeat protein
MSARLWLSLLVCVLSPLSLAAEELPPRAVARLGDYRFYHGNDLGYVAISYDGRRVLTGDFDSVAGPQRLFILWNATTGTEIRRWKLSDGSLSCVAFSPDGKQFAVGVNGDQVKPNFVLLFEAEMGKLVRRLDAFKNGVSWIGFSLDGRRLHAGEWNDNYFPRKTKPVVSSWDLTTGERCGRWAAPVIPPAETATNVTIWMAQGGLLSPDEKVLLWSFAVHSVAKKCQTPDVTGQDPVVRGYDAGDNTFLYELKDEHSLPNLFSADGKWMMLGNDLRTLRAIATGKRVRELKESPFVSEIVGLLPDGRSAVVRCDSGYRVCDLETGKLVSDKVVIAPAASGQCVVSGDGKTLLTSTGNTVRLWDLATGKERSLSTGHRQPLNCLWFSPDGKTLVSRCAETLCEWNVAQARERRRLALFRASANGACYDLSADGRTILVLYGDKLRLQELRTGKAICTIGEPDDQAMLGVTLSPRGDRVACLLQYKQPALEWFDLTTGKRLGKVAIGPWVGHRIFSPDGRYLA